MSYPSPPEDYEETQAGALDTTPKTRYDQEWVNAFWCAAWQEVALRCTGIQEDDPRMQRIRTHYFPLFDKAYSARDPQAWAVVMRNFNAGCPLPKTFTEWRVQEPPKQKVEPAAIVEEKEDEQEELPF